MSDAEYALGVHCGITFAGIKPASLFGLRREAVPAIEHCRSCFCRKGFAFEVMREDGERTLFYVYHRQKLDAVLFGAENRRFLEEEGYRYETAEQAVSQLKRRMYLEEFPHEIGIFLGYPLEDVKGFIAHPRRGVQLTGYWKVYENAEEKAKLFARFRKCSQSICGKMRSGKSLTAIFDGQEPEKVEIN